MSECKRIITPNTICTESALDAVCKLVADGMKVAPACKFVAEEYQKNYPEDKAEWKTLKRQYYRHNQPVKKSTTKKGDTSPFEKSDSAPFLVDEKRVTAHSFEEKLVQLDVPIYNAIEDELVKAKKYIKELEQKIKNLEYSNELLNTELLKIIGTEVPQQTQVLDNKILLTRPEINAAIERYGNDIQKSVLKDNKKNKELFKVFCGVRNRFLENNPPIGLPERLLNAKGCVDDSENDTTHI